MVKLEDQEDVNGLGGTSTVRMSLDFAVCCYGLAVPGVARSRGGVCADYGSSRTKKDTPLT